MLLLCILVYAFGPVVSVVAWTFFAGPLLSDYVQTLRSDRCLLYIGGGASGAI